MRHPVALVGKRGGFSASMRLYYELLRDGMAGRGIEVRGFVPPDRLSRRWPAGKVRYWCEYLEQYVLFPPRLRRALREWDAARGDGKVALAHVCDQSDALAIRGLGGRKTSLTVHDCIARRVLEGEFPGERKGALGGLQQRAIYRCAARFDGFAAISEATADDFRRFVPETVGRPLQVIPNAPAQPLRALERRIAEGRLKGNPTFERWSRAGCPPLCLVVGGDAFYKNRAGAVALVKACGRIDGAFPWLLVIGPGSAAESVFPPDRMLRRDGVSREELEAWYALAATLLFPSLAEGFGWPLLEALQCGCPVVTTDLQPMVSVAGPGALRLPSLTSGSAPEVWGREQAPRLTAFLSALEGDRAHRRDVGMKHAASFTLEAMLNGYEQLWQAVLDGTV